MKRTTLDYGCLAVMVLILTYIGLFIAFPVPMGILTIAIILVFVYCIHLADKEFKTRPHEANFNE